MTLVVERDSRFRLGGRNDGLGVMWDCERLGVGVEAAVDVDGLAGGVVAGFGAEVDE